MYYSYQNYINNSEDNKLPIFIQDWLIQEIKQQQFSQVWIGLNNLPRRDSKNYHWTDGSSLNTNIV